MKKLPLTAVLVVLTFVVASLLEKGVFGAGGDLLWEDQFDTAGVDDGHALNAIAVHGGRVFAAGRSSPVAEASGDFLVRAYDAR